MAWEITYYIDGYIFKYTIIEGLQNMQGKQLDSHAAM